MVEETLMCIWRLKNGFVRFVTELLTYIVAKANIWWENQFDLQANGKDGMARRRTAKEKREGAWRGSRAQASKQIRRRQASTENITGFISD